MQLRVPDDRYVPPVKRQASASSAAARDALAISVASSMLRAGFTSRSAAHRSSSENASLRPIICSIRSSVRKEERLADDARRFHVEEGHDVVSIERGADLRELLTFRQFCDTRLEVVHASLKFVRLRLVARRAICADELIQRVEEMTRVPHVSPDRSVGPPEAERVGPRCKKTNCRTSSMIDFGNPEFLQSLDGHTRADDLVMVEGHTFRTEGTCRRLPDVVHERTESADERRRHPFDNGERVMEDVLVPVHRVLFHRERGELGVILSASPVVTSRDNPRDGWSAISSFESSSRTRSRETIEHGPDHVDRFDDLVRDTEVEGRRETARTQHPEWVVREGLFRRGRRPQALLPEILETARRIEDLARRRLHGDRVDREITAGQ